MKKLLIGLLALGTITAYAGTITNKSSGQVISLEIHEQNNSKVVLIDGSNAGLRNRTIVLENMNIELKSSADKRDRGFDPIFMAANGCNEGSQVNDCGFGLVFAIGFDLVTLPVTVPLKLIHSSRIKNDLKLIHRSLYKDETIEINSRKFSRVIELLKL